MMRIKYYPPGEMGTKVSKQKYMAFLKLIYHDVKYRPNNTIIYTDVIIAAQSLWRFNRMKDIYSFINGIKRDTLMLEYEVESLERQYPEYAF